MAAKTDRMVDGINLMSGNCIHIYQWKFDLERASGIKYWASWCEMVETDSNLEPRNICPKCGQPKAATVSGTGASWSFKAKHCRCADEMPSPAEDKLETGASPAAEAESPASDPGKTSEKTAPETPEPETSGKSDVDNEKAETPAETKPDKLTKSADPGHVRPPHPGEKKLDDSGGWAIEQVPTTKKPAPPPPPPKPAKRKVAPENTGLPTPRSFGRIKPPPPDAEPSGVMEPADKANEKSPKRKTPAAEEIGESWVSMDGIGADDESAGLARKKLRESGVDRTENMPEAHQDMLVDMDAKAFGGAIAPLAVSSSSGNVARGSATITGANKKQEEDPVDWVVVAAKPPEKSKSQFANDAQLYDLVHQSDTAEEKEPRRSTRKAIQDAFRRNRVKTLILAALAICLTWGIYQYIQKNEAAKKTQISASKNKSAQNGKKSPGSRNQKKKQKRSN